MFLSMMAKCGNHCNLIFQILRYVDLVLKNDDVVLGSHGRGFWILDDIRPLRAAVETTTNNEVTLYKPANPIRGVYDAAIPILFA